MSTREAILADAIETKKQLSMTAGSLCRLWYGDLFCFTGETCSSREKNLRTVINKSYRTNVLKALYKFTLV